MSSKSIPEPWYSFLADLDAALTEEVELHSLGGFVVTMHAMTERGGILEIKLVAPNIDADFAQTHANSLDSDDHRIRTDQVLYSGFAETCIAHPARTILTRVIKSTRSLNQHVEAHQQAKGIQSPLVINLCLKHDQRAAFRQRAIGLSKQYAFLVKVPIVQDVAHRDHFGRRNRVFKKIARQEFELVAQAI